MVLLARFARGLLRSRSFAFAHTRIHFTFLTLNPLQVLEENYLLKVKHSPDFAHMSTQDALDDLSKRVENYEKQYETISDDDMSYIKVFNLSSKIMCNNIYGRVSKTILPCLMAWNIGSRPIWLIRAGETEDPVRSVKVSEPRAKRIKLKKGESLDRP